MRGGGPIARSLSLCLRLMQITSAAMSPPQKKRLTTMIAMIAPRVRPGDDE